MQQSVLEKEKFVSPNAISPETNTIMKPKFINKEISWLSFNERVLQEAADASVPIIERIKFLGICSSNLDEFYRVRVATLRRLVNLGKKAKKLIGDDPRDVLKEIQKKTKKQHKDFDEIYQQLLKELAKNNIFVIDETQLTDEQGEHVKSFFRLEVRPKLIPIMIDQIEGFPALKDRMIYLAVRLVKNDNMSKAKFALIEIPSEDIPRFFVLPKTGNKNFIILLDDVIRYQLKDIFSIFSFDKSEAYTIKITRDAELELETDLEESYLKKVVKGLKHRKEGNPVRLIYDSKMPVEMVEFITKKMRISGEDTIIAGSKYHNNRDFIKFPKVGSKELRYDSQAGLLHHYLEKEKGILQAIQKKDVLLHYPYHSFNYFIDLLREASIDPKVTSIKITVYRVAPHSSVMNALINAVKNGKSVTVVLELQARFDEEANVYWADRLQEEGVKVIFGVPGLKVHSKLCLITRREKEKPVHYATIGTGNFNEDTATIYSDHILLTAEKGITKEVNKIFEFFANNYKSNVFKHLIVSPFNMRQKFINMINTEKKNASEGKEAYIIFKLNNLVDTKIITKLYEASQAGVKIKLIVRGMFSLVPGIEGLSENIEAISIVDKYLEHSRIYVFCNDGDERYFITSADLMPRNIDRRVEVTCPVYDKKIQNELKEFLKIQWEDNVKARLLNSNQDNQFRKRDSFKKLRAQWILYDFISKNNIE